MDNLPETMPEVTPPGKEVSPALTIHIHSWATPIAGLVMLLIGLVAGYFGRPLLDSAFVRATSTPLAVPTLVATAADTASQEQPEIKSLVVAQTRHFIGSENAPVTIIEFSDFQ